ncbi:MAG: YbjN domain-containing protein [Sandaracinaceae bacterium]|nr:YbjN domain-containing protein [Sandaracinaceae bacterium]
MSTDEAKREVERASALVEQTIRALGIDPTSSRRDRDGHVVYALRRGSARILIAIHAPSGELTEGRIRVVAPVVVLPAADRQLELLRHLLTANATDLVGAAFAISGDDVVVVAERALRDLDASEVDAMVRNVGRVADRYDDELSTAFSLKRSSDA